MGEFGTMRRRVQKVQRKTSEVQHFFFEPACNRSIVPLAHFALCPKLDIHGTDLSYTLQKVLNRGLSLAISAITNREINEL